MPEFYTRDNLAQIISEGLAEVGDHTYGNPTVRWWGEKARLRIGPYCSIADGVTIFLGGNHRTDWVSTYPFSHIPQDPWGALAIQGHPATRGDVAIGADVWIGDGAAILSGVTIGHGAVIGARAVVGRDIPPYAIVAGNPARILRHRFPPETVAALLEVAWWERSEAEIRALVPYLLSGDMPAFFRAAGHSMPQKRHWLRRLLPARGPAGRRP